MIKNGKKIKSEDYNFAIWQWRQWLTVSPRVLTLLIIQFYSLVMRYIYSIYQCIVSDASFSPWTFLPKHSSFACSNPPSLSKFFSCYRLLFPRSFHLTASIPLLLKSSTLLTYTFFTNSSIFILKKTKSPQNTIFIPHLTQQ